jgi:hypothetical protein
MHLAIAQPLLAVDFMQVAIPLVVLFFAVMKQLFDVNKKVGAQREGGPAMPPQPQPQPQPAMQKPVPAGGQQADQLRSQVEEFLRRAGRLPQGGQPQRPQQPTPASQIDVLLSDASQSPKRTSLAESLRSRESRSSPKTKPAVADADTRPVRRSVVPKQRETLAERAAVREASRLSKLPEQPPHLGQRIIEDDEQFDIQLKAKFDHTVGTLAESGRNPQSPDVAPTRETPAAQIAAMLANPDGVRQAVIINEILRRPSDRW